MNYAEFKEQVVLKFKDYLPESMKDYKVYVHEVMKNNCIKDGITLFKESPSLMPTLYINDLYDAYRFFTHQDFDKVMKDYTKKYMEYVDTNPLLHIKSFDKAISAIFTKAYISDHVIMTLVNADRNKKILENSLHIKWLDFAILFNVVIENVKDDIELISYNINNKVADLTGVTLDEVFAWAKINTFRLLPIEVYRMGDDNDMVKMYVATSKQNKFGANVILCKEFLREFSQAINNDFYILPSSMHEVIIIPADSIGLDAEELYDMVWETNHLLNPEDFLSNSVYKYTRETDSIDIVDIKKGSLHYEK